MRSALKPAAAAIGNDAARAGARWTLVLIASALYAGSARAVPWEWGLGTWSGSLGLHYESTTQTAQLLDGPGSASSSRLLRETFRISNKGFYVVDPRLFTGNLTVELGRAQIRDSGADTSAPANDRLIGYAFDSTFLAEKPYTATLFANRNQSQSLQLFGGRMDGTHENHGAGFHLRQNSVLNDWGFPWFESNLYLRSEHNKSKTSIFGQSLLTDETSKSLQFDASKGFEHADLGLNVQLNKQQNAVFETGNFTSKAAGLTYSLDFGPNLNRRLDARLNYLSRDGSSPATTTSTSERLHVDHDQNLATDYLYSLTAQDVGGRRSTLQNAAFSVAHQFYQNLHTTAGLRADRATLQNGATSSYGGRFNQNYTHSLPGKGNFTANWSAGYQLNSNDLNAARISIVDETHLAPSLFAVERGFLLDHPFAEANNLQVFNARGGGRIPLAAGIDFDVIAEGSQLRIVPRAGTLLIVEGDPLLVSYSYQVDQHLKYSAKSTGFGLGVDYRWIGVSFSHLQSKQTPMSANASTSLFLDSYNQDTLRLSSQGRLLEMTENTSLDFDRYKSTRTVYDRRRFSSTWQWPVTSRLRMNFGLNASDTQYTLPSRHKNVSRSALGSLDWNTEGGWTNSASLDWSKYSNSGLPSQTLMRADLHSSLAFGQLTLSARLNFSESITNGLRSKNGGFNIDAVRQF